MRALRHRHPVARRPRCHGLHLDDQPRSPQSRTPAYTHWIATQFLALEGRAAA
ncbi:hypothetical protein LT493_37305 [Streptomyces tricolor]|nr:hypothetical protein [Streptomyces tricolor]